MVHPASFGSFNAPDEVEAFCAALHVSILHGMLRADDLCGWQLSNFKESAPLDPWIRDNAVHALESCPDVLAHWRATFRLRAEAWDILYGYVGAAFEQLDDTAKMAILWSMSPRKAHQGLYRYIKEDESNWSVLSPAWIGRPGSDLRAMAVEQGWSDFYFPHQVSRFISSPAAREWQQWVPYAHSLCVFHRFIVTSPKKRYPSDEELQPVEHVGQIWARPEDMALARSLSKHRPDYLYTVTPHPDAAPVPDELQERMDALVAAHAGLGMMETLKAMVVQGTWPMFTSDLPLELPELDSTELEHR